MSGDAPHQIPDLYKVLLLGTARSGKTTLFKQFMQMYEGGFNDKFIFDTTRSIFVCVIIQMQSIIYHAIECKYELKSEIQQRADFITDLPPNIEFTSDVANAIEMLWKDKQIKTAFKERSNLGIYDCAEYFFEEIQRIADPNYLPTKKDILLVCTTASGIRTRKFEVENQKYEIFDAGCGSRSERRKWVYCCDTVWCKLFIIAMCMFCDKLKKAL